jgi:hypothetical protein
MLVKDNLRVQRLIGKCLIYINHRILATSCDVWRENSAFQHRLRVVRESTVKQNRTTTAAALKKCSLWPDIRKDRPEWVQRIDREPPTPTPRNYKEDWSTLVGDLPESEFKTENRVVRFFVSSTFDDTLHERNFLLEDVIPYVMECAQNRGLDIALSEMRFGIREKASADNRTLEICLDELRHCQQVSAGLNFILIAGDKYGFRPCPYRIDKEQFDALLVHMQPEEARLVLDCYYLDENAEVPEYIMKSQDDIIDFWNGVFQSLRTALQRAAERLWPDKLQELRDPRRSKRAVSARVRPYIQCQA